MKSWLAALREPFAKDGNRRRWQALTGVVATLALAGLVAGCGGSSSSSTSSGGGEGGSGEVLRYGVTGGLESLNPAKDVVNGTSNIRYLTNEALLTLDPKTGEYGPGLATSFGFIGKDNTGYELKLRKGVKFSDGTPLDAQAVKKWLEYFAGAGGGFAALIQFKSIETPDANTVRMTFKVPTPNVEYYLAGGNNWGFVSSPKATPAQLSKNTYGVGPYVLDAGETLAGDHYTFVPNPNYYDPSKAAWGKIVVRVLAQPSTMLSAMKAGELDVAYGDFSTVQAAEQLPEAQVVSGVTGWDPILLLPEYAEELKDVRVRQALNYAIDREAITEAMLGDYGEPTSEWVTTDGFDPAFQDYYSYDPEKAKKLLAEAGLADGFTLKTVDQGYTGNLGDPMVQIVAQDLSEVGVKLDITKATSAGEHFEKGTSGEYGAWQFALGSVPAATFLSLFTPEMGGQPDPQLEKIAAEATTAPAAQAEELWKEFSRRTVTQASMLNVFTTPTLLYASDSISGIDVTDVFGVSPELLEWRHTS